MEFGLGHITRALIHRAVMGQRCPHKTAMASRAVDGRAKRTEGFSGGYLGFD